MTTLSSILPLVNVSQASGTLPVGNGGIGATTLTANNVLLGNGASALQVVAPGTTGNVLTSDGTTWISQAGAAAASVQTFSSSGTWTKPSGAQFVLVEAWGAGGGGSRPTTSTTGSGGTINLGSGGGGGSYNFELFLASSLGSTEVVTVGAGGAGGITNNSAGNNGGSTDLGQKVFGFGGAGGSNGSFGGGGAGIAAGAVSSSTPGGPLIGTNQTQNMAGGYGGTSAARAGGASAYGGGGGGSGSSGTSSSQFSAGGGDSVYGAGGGGGPAAYRVIGGGTDFTCQGDAGVGGSLASTTAGSRVRPLFGQNGVDYSGGAGGAYYEFPNFAMTQSNDSGIALFNANNGAQVVSVGTAGFVPFIFVSPDGVTAATPYPIPLKYQDTPLSVFHNGTSYFIFTSNNVVSTSTFTTFTRLSYPQGYGSINATSYANGYFFIGSNIDVFYSTDCISWTRANVAGGASVDMGSVAYDGTYYYAARSGGTVYRSTNLSTWASYISGASGGSYYIKASPTEVVLGSQSSPFLRISTNQGVTWANTVTNLGNGIQNINYISSQSRWFASTFLPDLWTSTDGTNWVTANLTVSLVRNVIHNGTVFAASARTAGTAQVNQTATSATGAWTARTTNGLAATVTGQPGGNGGLGGGGGGPGGAATTTTGNGGNGGNGFCRVYTW